MNTLPHSHTHYEDTLAAYMHDHGVTGTMHRFTNSCHSVAQAAASAGAPIEQFVKNICMTTELGLCVIAIMRGSDRASVSTIAKLLNQPSLRLATTDEVLTLTGYPAGGTPSFGFNATFLMDTKVMALDTVWTGGGSEYALVCSTAQAVQFANGAQVAKLRNR